MNSPLSFRKESIQRSSDASEAMNQQAVGFTEVQDPRRSGDRAITLTTSLTTI